MSFVAQNDKSDEKASLPTCSVAPTNEGSTNEAAILIAVIDRSLVEVTAAANKACPNGYSIADNNSKEQSGTALEQKGTKRKSPLSAKKSTTTTKASEELPNLGGKDAVSTSFDETGATVAKAASEAGDSDGVAANKESEAETKGGGVKRKRGPQEPRANKAARGKKATKKEPVIWGQFYTPPVDLVCEEILKEPNDFDWLGPVLRKEAETAWPTHVASQSLEANDNNEEQTKASQEPVDLEKAALSDDGEEKRAEEEDEGREILEKIPQEEGLKQPTMDVEQEEEGSEKEEDRKLPAVETEPEQQNHNDSGDCEDMPEGIADQERMAAKISALFYEGRQFCNFFQAKQLADYVCGRWGVRLKMTNKDRIACCYGHMAKPLRSAKAKVEADAAEALTSPAAFQRKTRIRRQIPLAATNCPFHISLRFKVTGKFKTASGEKIDLPRTKNPVVVMRPSLNCFTHNHECSADTYDYAVKKMGGNLRSRGPNHTKPVVPTTRERKEGGDVVQDLVTDLLPKDRRVEQCLFPWGGYYTPESGAEAMEKIPDLHHMDIDWIRGPLLEEVKKAWPRPGDISEDLVSNPDAMLAALSTVFYPNRQFCNIYQAHQMADLVLGRWGGRIKQHQGQALGCCYGFPGNRSKRRWEKGVPFQRKMSAQAISATNCPFFVSFTFRYPTFKNGKSTGICRTKNPVRVTIYNLTHNHDCSADSLRAVKQSCGAYSSNLGPNEWKEILDVLDDAEDKDTGAAIRKIMQPFYPPSVPITSSIIANIRARGRNMIATGEQPEDIYGAAQINEFVAKRQQPFQSLDLSGSLRDHFTVVTGFENNIKSESNPMGCLEWHCPPDTWAPPSDPEQREGRDGRWHVDPESGGLIVYPAAKKNFWRRTHFEPLLIKDDGAFLRAALECSRHYTVEAAFQLAGACESDQAGLFVRLDDEHWIKAGVEAYGDRARFVCSVTNIYTDASSQPWPSGVDTRQGRFFPGDHHANRPPVLLVNCHIRIHCRGANFIVHARQEDQDWEVVRIAHMSRSIVENDPATALLPEEAAADDSGLNPDRFWAGVYACCPQDQLGGHAIFETFEVVEGSSYDGHQY